jgi:hypothetical protein
VIAQRLHLATGFLSSERDWIVLHLAARGPGCAPFRTQVELEISRKERHGAGQRVTVERWISRTPRLHLVCPRHRRGSWLWRWVRDDLIRQVDDGKTRTETRSRLRRDGLTLIRESAS